MDKNSGANINKDINKNYKKDYDKNIVKKLIREVLPYKRAIIVVAICGAIMSLAKTQIAIIIKDLFDSLESKNAKEIIAIPLTILGIYFIAAVSRYFHFYLMNFIADKIIVNIRQKLQRKFMDLNLTFHNNFPSGTGGLLSRIMNDINIIRYGLLFIGDFIREPILILGLIIWLFILDWQLTLSIFILLPLLFLFLKQIARSLRKYGKNSQEIMEDLTMNVKEVLDGVRTVQSYNLENEMFQRFKSKTDEFLVARKKIYARVEGSGPITELVATAVVSGIFIYLGLQIVNHKATLGDFASFLASLLMMQQPIKKLQDSFVRVQETLVAARRFFEILDNENTVKQNVNVVEFPQNFNKIIYKDVFLNYGKENILKNINFEVNRGEVVAFVGESGSGKSSLVNILERFFDPSQGQILIDDIPLDHINIKSLRDNIAYVGQEAFLFSDTVQKNIHAGCFDKDPKGVIKSAEMANALNFINKMPDKFQSLVGDKGNLLSGGEKQRINIARALFKNAPILILDEATSALDSVSELEVQKGIEQLIKGRTVFVIAHRLSTIIKADRIFVLKNGRILEEGKHHELINQKGEYQKFYTLQTSS